MGSKVVERVEEDLRGLRELLRVSRGLVILTVPAHMYLWTDSATILLHKRRYARRDLLRLIDQAGGRALKMGSYGLIPALLVIAYRLVSSVTEVFKNLGRGERSLPLAWRFRLPRPMDAVMMALFSAVFGLSEWGLVLWGHCCLWAEIVPKDSRPLKVCAHSK